MMGTGVLISIAVLQNMRRLQFLSVTIWSADLLFFHRDFPPTPPPPPQKKNKTKKLSSVYVTNI